MHPQRRANAAALMTLAFLPLCLSRSLSLLGRMNHAWLLSSNGSEAAVSACIYVYTYTDRLAFV